MIRFIISLVLLGGCSPLLGAGSFVHAVVTGNTTAQVVGATDIVIERKTGKSVKEHIWYEMNTPKDTKEKIVMGKRIEWIYLP